MAADALAPYVASASVAMILTTRKGNYECWKTIPDVRDPLRNQSEPLDGVMLDKRYLVRATCCGLH